MNSEFQSDLSILAFKNGEQLESFHVSVLILQQEIILSGETISPTRLIFQYMKTLSNSENLKNLIAHNITYLVTLLDNNRKSAAYTGGNINGLYSYLEMNGSTTKLNTSERRPHNFRPSSSINNDAANIQPVIAAPGRKHKSIYKCCGRIGLKADTCIIRGPKFLWPSLIINMNQFNALHGEWPNDSPRE